MLCITVSGGSCVLTWFDLQTCVFSQISGFKNKKQKSKQSFKKSDYIDEDELGSDSDIPR